MRPLFTPSTILLALTLLGGAARARDSTSDPHPEPVPPLLPASLIDVDGKKVDVAALARAHRLIFITLKASWCPACAEQLVRLGRKVSTLRTCGATFVVLSPGPTQDLARVRDHTGFPYPFVVDENLSLGRQLGLLLAEDQLIPAIFAVDAKRRIAWTRQGRSIRYYGDQALEKYLRCEGTRSAQLPLTSPQHL
ncbi:MAG: redoxin family protein [Candidatus Latescibacterota bacterium]|nr:redoxin family protein [Candidatus Latescibacterota bacterium]